MLDDRRHLLAMFTHLDANQAHVQYRQFMALIAQWPLIDGEDDPDDEPLTVNGG
jgi:hypothetical protein